MSDSGLGCGPGGSGVNGWPLCNGDIVPGFSLNTAIVSGHAKVAGSPLGARWGALSPAVEEPGENYTPVILHR